MCALQKDFQQFPHGDQTLVGERGASLSGGQRARINLARAVYRQVSLDQLDLYKSHIDCLKKYQYLKVGAITSPLVL